MAKKSKAQVAQAMEVPEYKPSLELSESMYKGLKDLKIDDEIEVKLKVKVKSISRREWRNNELCVMAEIQNAKPEKYSEDVDED